MSARIFLLSPASLRGVRGRRILSGTSGADFMDALLAGRAVPLGDVYAFISSLYYRGKRSYARRFGRREGGRPSVFVVTPTRGILPDDHDVGLDDLETFASTAIDPAEPAYLVPLRDTAHELRRKLGDPDEVVLLGSIASTKYRDPLEEIFGRRLLFPAAFIGRGDMSRGGLLLRAVDAGRELPYVIATEADRRGGRPARLDPGTRPGARGNAGG